MQPPSFDDRKMPVTQRSSSDQPPNEGQPRVCTDEDIQALFVPSSGLQKPSVVRPLPLAVAVPQISLGIDAPFARAYSPELAASGIEMDDWLEFCDGLNIAYTASPPLRVVDYVGLITGLVPFDWAMVAGAVMQTIAQSGASALSKSLSDRYLRNANENYFAPRGLRVRLCKNSAMRQLVGIDTPPARPSKVKETAKSVGHGFENVGLRIPVVRELITQLHPAPAVDQNMGRDQTSRRLRALQGYALSLDFDVPPPKTPVAVLDKFSALASKLNQRVVGRAQAKATRARDLMEIRKGGSDISGLTLEEGERGKKARKAERKASEDLQQGKFPRESSSLRMKVAVEDRKEANSALGILWIVVLNAEEDKQIQDVALADSNVNVEQVRDMERDDELDLQNEEGRRHHQEKPPLPEVMATNPSVNCSA
ncbi:hypothetical protein FRB96_001938 [Tulasnella sp. 330]|nr:hypothetical protein FRB96_001938 [Tulasnella sp. 330]KAG8872796.1 hypothetical protein FRB97_007341 [Tulasnella sp. 331]